MSDQQVIDLLDRVTTDLTRTRHDPGRDLPGSPAPPSPPRRDGGGVVAVLALVGGAASLALGGGTDMTGRVADPGPTHRVGRSHGRSRPAPEPRRFGLDPAKTGLELGSLLQGDVTKQRSWHARAGETDDFRGGSVLRRGR